MTSDGKNGLQIAYNALDLPRKVSSSGTTLVNYSYLAEGTRTAALKPYGSGLVQRGSLTYRRGADGSLRFAFTGKEALKRDEQRKKDGGAKSSKGTSGNAINGVSSKNPKKQQYEEARKRENRGD